MPFICQSTAYDDLVVPLRKNCPDALDVPNKAGVTPKDMLQWVKFGMVSKKMQSSWYTEEVKSSLVLVFMISITSCF